MRGGDHNFLTPRIFMLHPFNILFLICPDLDALWHCHHIGVLVSLPGLGGQRFYHITWPCITSLSKLLIFNFTRRGISPFYIEESIGAAIGVWPAVIVIIHNLHIFVGGKFLSPRGAIFVPSPPPTPSYSIYMIALERDPC